MAFVEKFNSNAEVDKIEFQFKRRGGQDRTSIFGSSSVDHTKRQFSTVSTWTVPNFDFCSLNVDHTKLRFWQPAQWTSSVDQLSGLAQWTSSVDQLSGPEEQQQEDLGRLHTTAQWGGRVQPGEIIH